MLKVAQFKQVAKESLPKSVRSVIAWNLISRVHLEQKKVFPLSRAGRFIGHRTPVFLPCVLANNLSETETWHYW